MAVVNSESDRCAIGPLIPATVTPFLLARTARSACLRPATARAAGEFGGEVAGVAAGEPADGHNGIRRALRRLGRGDPQPDPAAPDAERAEQADDHGERRDQQVALAGVVADLDAGPRHPPVEGHRDAVREGGALADGEVDGA